MGRHVSDVANELFGRNAYRDYLELHGLSVQLTEALAEMWHARIRAELGFGPQDSTDLQAMLSKQAYRGSRYSFGYPACPNIEDQAQLEVLLDWQRIGIELSEEQPSSRPSSRPARSCCTTPRRSTSRLGDHERSAPASNESASGEGWRQEVGAEPRVVRPRRMTQPPPVSGEGG